MGCREWEGDCGAVAIPSSGLNKHAKARTESGNGGREEQGQGGGRLKIQDGGEEGAGGKDFQDRSPRRLWLAAWDALFPIGIGIGIAIGIGIEPDSSLPKLFDSEADSDPDSDPDSDACGEGVAGRVCRSADPVTERVCNPCRGR